MMSRSALRGPDTREVVPIRVIQRNDTRQYLYVHYVRVQTDLVRLALCLGS